MKKLADAWSWYEATKQNLERMRRLGEKYWIALSALDAPFFQDDRFRMVERDTIIAETNAGLEVIDDLAIVVLFSVFESQVREYLTDLIRPEADTITHPILKDAAEDAIRGIEEGSFYRRVLDPLKKQGHVASDLVTQVDQVRDYRNWVAHGRRDEPTNNVTPRDAYDRLAEFLAALRISAEEAEDNPT